MLYYFVNKMTTVKGEHEVHHENCVNLPDEKSRIKLGLYVNCHEALIEARNYYNQCNGCIWCSKECHFG